MTAYQIDGVVNPKAVVARLVRRGYFAGRRGQTVYAVGPTRPWACLAGQAKSGFEVKEIAMADVPKTMALPATVW